MSSSKYNYLFFLNGSILASFLFLYNKSEGFFDVSRIRTCIVRREGTYDDHLSTTTTTAQNSFPLFETKNGYLLMQKIPMHNSAFKINIVAFRLNTYGEIPASFLFYFRIFYMSQFKYNLIKAQMVFLGFEPRAAKWKAQTNPLSCNRTPFEDDVTRHHTSLTWPSD